MSLTSTATRHTYLLLASQTAAGLAVAERLTGTAVVVVADRSALELQALVTSRGHPDRHHWVDWDAWQRERVIGLEERDGILYAARDPLNVQMALNSARRDGGATQVVVVGLGELDLSIGRDRLTGFLTKLRQRWQAADESILLVGVDLDPGLVEVLDHLGFTPAAHKGEVGALETPTPSGDPTMEQRLLATLPGVGAKKAAALHAGGIRSIGQVATAGEVTIDRLVSAGRAIHALAVRAVEHADFCASCGSYLAAEDPICGNCRQPSARWLIAQQSPAQTVEAAGGAEMEWDEDGVVVRPAQPLTIPPTSEEDLAVDGDDLAADREDLDEDEPETSSPAGLFLCPVCGHFLTAEATSCPNCQTEFAPEVEAEEPLSEESRLEEDLGEVGLLGEDLDGDLAALEAADAAVTEAPTTSLMLCPECGAFLSEATTSCFSCGVEFATEEDETEEVPISDQVREDPAVVAAPTPTIHLCPHCGAMVEEFATDCTQCGKDLDQAIDLVLETVGELEDLVLGADVDDLLDAGNAEEPGDPETLTRADLFLCPECGAFLSDAATSCFSCGVEFSEAENDEELALEEVSREEPATTEVDILAAVGLAHPPGDMDTEEVTAALDELAGLDSQPQPSTTVEGEGGLFLCTDCGAFLSETASECPSCGTSLEEEFVGSEEIGDLDAIAELAEEAATSAVGPEEAPLAEPVPMGGESLDLENAFGLPETADEDDRDLLTEGLDELDELEQLYQAGDFEIDEEEGTASPMAGYLADFIDALMEVDEVIDQAGEPLVMADQPASPLLTVDEEAELDICQACGAFLTGGITTCSVCGEEAKTGVPAPAAASPLTDLTRLCPECGAAQGGVGDHCEVCKADLVSVAIPPWLAKDGIEIVAFDPSADPATLAEEASAGTGAGFWYRSTAELAVCGACGAFVIDGAPECQVCKEPVTALPPHPAQTVVTDADGFWYRDTGDLGLCAHCGAFLSKGTTSCLSCGVAFTEERTDEGLAPEEVTSEGPAVTEIDILAAAGMAIPPGDLAAEETTPALDELAGLDIQHQPATTEKAEVSLFLCTECGAFLSETATTCSNCGTSLEEDFEESEEAEDLSDIDLVEELAEVAAIPEAGPEEAILAEFPPGVDDLLDLEDAFGLPNAAGEDRDQLTEGLAELDELEQLYQAGDFEIDEEESAASPMAGYLADFIDALMEVDDIFDQAGEPVVVADRPPSAAPTTDEEAELNLCLACGAFLTGGATTCPVCGELATALPQAPTAEEDSAGTGAGFWYRSTAELAVCGACGAFVIDGAAMCQICEKPVTTLPPHPAQTVVTDADGFWYRDTGGLGLCAHCGAFLTDGSTTCRVCGEEATPVDLAPEVAAPLTGLTRLCPDCGAAQGGDEERCEVCSADLVSVEIPTWLAKDGLEIIAFDPSADSDQLAAIARPAAQEADGYWYRDTAPLTVCAHCGSFVPGDAGTCTSCGMAMATATEMAEQARFCPECGSLAEVTDHVCSVCGIDLMVAERAVQRCPSCGGLTDTGAACVLCGFDIVIFEEAEEGLAALDSLADQPLGDQTCGGCGSHFPLLEARCPVCGMEPIDSVADQLEVLGLLVDDDPMAIALLEGDGPEPVTALHERPADLGPLPLEDGVGFTHGLGRTEPLGEGDRARGLTNGLGRTNGLTNGLGRTNGLTNGLGRTNGLTNGLGRTEPLGEGDRARGLTNGLGRTNGLTNGLGRTNGLTNGLGRTNGLTNGLGRTNGLTNGLGRTEPLGEGDRARGLTNGLGRTNGLTNGLGRTNGLTNGLGRTNGLTNGLADPLTPAEVAMQGGILYPGQPFEEGFLAPLQRGAGLVNGTGLVNGIGLGTRSIRRPGMATWHRFAVLGVFLLLMASIAVFVTPRLATGGEDSILIDGDLADWSGIAPVLEATLDAQPPDLDLGMTRVMVAGDRLHVGIEFPGAPFGSGVGPGAVLIAVDTDGDPATGYAMGPLGIDQLAVLDGYGSTLYHRSLLTWNGVAPAWDFRGLVPAGSLPAVVGQRAIELTFMLPSGSADPIVRVETRNATVRADVTDAYVTTNDGAPTFTGSIMSNSAPALGPSTHILWGGAEYDEECSISAWEFRVDDGGAVTWTLSIDGREILAERRGSDLTFPVTGCASAWILTGVPIPEAADDQAVRVELTGTTGTSRFLLEGQRSWSGYARSAPTEPRIDGLIADWPAAGTMAVGGVALEEVALSWQPDSLSGYVRLDPAWGDGMSIPIFPTPLTEATDSTGSTPVRDSDIDGIPDHLDAFPFDFDNDGTPDALENGDIDGDGELDFANGLGSDYWLENPFTGARRYIGPAPAFGPTGADRLLIHIDRDQDQGTGFHLGTMGVDDLLILNLKDDTVVSAAVYRFEPKRQDPWLETGDLAAASRGKVVEWQWVDDQVDASRSAVMITFESWDGAVSERTDPVSAPVPGTRAAVATSGVQSGDNDPPMNDRTPLSDPPSASPPPVPATAATTVVINEISSNGPNDWIELVNPTGSPVDISGWTIRTGGGGGTTIYTFPAGTILGAWLSGSEYLTIDLGAAFPDDPPLIRLFDASGSEVDGFNGKNLRPGETHARFREGDTGYPDDDDDNKDWYKSNVDTKGKANDRNRPKIQVTKTDSADPVNPGDTLIYTITISNTDKKSTTGTIWANDTFPAGLVYVSDTASAAGEFISSDTSGSTLAFEFTGLAPESSITFTITFTTNNTIGALITNVVDVEANDVLENPLPPVQATEDTTVNFPAPFLTIVKTADRNDFEVGTQRSYTITIQNIGGETTGSVWVNDTLPLSLTYLSDTAGGGNFVGSTINGQDLSYEFSGIPSGGSVSFDIYVDVGIEPATTFTNTAEVTWTNVSGGLFAPQDDTVSVGNQRPRVSIEKVADLSTAVAGDLITYTIYFNNSGNKDADTVWINDTLPAGVTFVSTTAGTLPTLQSQDTSGSPLLFEFARVRKGISYSFDIVVQVNASVPYPSVINVVNLDYERKDTLLEPSQDSAVTYIPEWDRIGMLVIVAFIIVGIGGWRQRRDGR